MEEQKLVIGNLQACYKTFGSPEDKPFLILHGWSSSSNRWEPVAELLKQKNLFIVVPDLPGFGKSQEPPMAWNIDKYMEWVREFCDTIPVLKNEFYLAGHSFGGAIATKFSIKYPQKVEKLVLVAAACVRRKTFAKSILYGISKIVKLFSFLPYYAKVRRGFYKFAYKKSDYPYVSGVMKDTYLRVISEDLTTRLPFVKVPTTLIWGDKDEATPLEFGKIIHKGIENSTLTIIPGADHRFQKMEFPEILSTKILEAVS